MNTAMTIIGSGLIGSNVHKFFRGNLESFPSTTVIAAGNSNSQERDPIPLKKEVNFIEDILKKSQLNEQFIYISTSSIYNSENGITPYVENKKKIESLIIANSPSSIILRLPNVVGEGGNPSNIVNYFVDKILTNQPFDARVDEFRNFIAASDIGPFIQNCLQEQRQGIIPFNHPKSARVLELIKHLEEILNKTAKYNPIRNQSAQDFYPCDPAARHYFANHTINVDEYLPIILQQNL